MSTEGSECKGCAELVTTYAWMFSSIDSRSEVVCPVCRKAYTEFPQELNK